ncbi:rab GTPase-binding effector protein 2 [Megalops cyprinoides]|uniref:rab GTPase-binding effector protein 2 n=1 Tax=Megalops cyprinoides TaxID=118141 RepID=UPI0018647294|nr:rab GTPase-binding effector protein 2 [Megalops cyprinoides]
MEQPEMKPTSSASEEMDDLQAQLADCRAQLEHWQGVATICEMSKQEELGELQRQCDQEIQSLQEALRETVAQYEARISALQSERAQWKRVSHSSQGNIKKGKSDGEPVTKEGHGERDTSPISSQRGRQADKEMGIQAERHDGERADLEARGEGGDSEGGSEGGESEGGSLLIEGYFSQHCDTSSLSSFSLDTPSLPRRLPPQDDTASLLSTGTLVPEAIYLPPAGHRLITHSDWDALHAQVTDLQGEVTRLREERADLEKELVTHTTDTQRQVTVLQTQVQTSENLLQELQKSLSQSQSAVKSRLAELSLSQKRMCSELSRLRGERVEEGGEHSLTDISPTQQGAHCEERLRIEIVNLKEQLDTRTEESEVLEVQLSSLKTETDRIQCQNDKLQSELQACRTELSGLRVALSHLQRDSKAQSSDKAALQQQCLELRSQMISLRSQLDTSQAVQRDFVQLSQSLQVKLELIRQAESLDQVKEILGEALTDDHTEPRETT